MKKIKLILNKEESKELKNIWREIKNKKPKTYKSEEFFQKMREW